MRLLLKITRYDDEGNIYQADTISKDMSRYQGKDRYEQWALAIPEGGRLEIECL